MIFSSEANQVKIAAVVGFPLGSSTSQSKAFEANELVNLGASEIDMVINIGKLLDKNYRAVYEDVKAVVDSIGSRALVKVSEKRRR